MQVLSDLDRGFGAHLRLFGEGSATSFLIEAMFIDTDGPEKKEIISHAEGRSCSASGYHRQPIHTGALRVREYIARNDRNAVTETKAL